MRVCVRVFVCVRFRVCVACECVRVRAFLVMLHEPVFRLQLFICRTGGKSLLQRAKLPQMGARREAICAVFLPKLFDLFSFGVTTLYVANGEFCAICGRVLPPVASEYLRSQKTAMRSPLTYLAKNHSHPVPHASARAHQHIISISCFQHTLARTHRGTHTLRSI